jgi:Fur family transcriptional regulator, ferric uptake regulator
MPFERIETEASIQSSGLKLTTPRLKILQVLRDAKKRHLSVEDIYLLLHKDGSDLGIATVYRVLGQFEQAGLLIRQHFDGVKAVYELNEGLHHDHIVCQSCGKVDEFHDDEIERLQRHIAESRGFQLHDHTLALFGICAQCASNQAASKPSHQI